MIYYYTSIDCLDTAVVRSKTVDSQDSGLSLYFIIGIRLPFEDKFKLSLMLLIGRLFRSVSRVLTPASRLTVTDESRPEALHLLDVYYALCILKVSGNTFVLEVIP